MKLLMCNRCGDIFNLCFHTKKCSCGHTHGKYISHSQIITHNGKLIGFDNQSFSNALKNYSNFNAFVIKKENNS